jgi:hypothetical protein
MIGKGWCISRVGPHTTQLCDFSISLTNSAEFHSAPASQEDSVRNEVEWYARGDSNTRPLAS